MLLSQINTVARRAHHFRKRNFHDGSPLLSNQHDGALHPTPSAAEQESPPWTDNAVKLARANSQISKRTPRIRRGTQGIEATDHKRVELYPSHRSLVFEDSAKLREKQEEASAREDSVVLEAHAASRSPGFVDPSADASYERENPSAESENDTTQSASAKKELTPDERFKILSEQAHRKVYNGSIPARVIPSMLETIRSVRKLGLPDQTSGHPPENEAPKQRSRLRKSTLLLERRSLQLAKQFSVKRSDVLWRERLRARMKLPVMANGRYNQIYTEMNNADVLIIPGSTGSGKTTQVPQIIFDYHIRLGRGAFVNVLCTQPRRISATSVARRVAWERNENPGEFVGHHVRFSSVLPRSDGSILYCTSGVLWKYLQTQPDHILDTVSHVVIDEVHERSTELDLILLTLRKMLYERRQARMRFPKLVLMSATMKTHDFVKYFTQAPSGQKPLRTAVLDIPGRVHPITDFYLEDYLPELQASAHERPLDQSSEAYLKTAMEVPSQTSASNSLSMEKFSTEETEDDTLVETGDENDLANNYNTRPEQWNFESLVPASLTARVVSDVLANTDSGDILVFLPGLAEIDHIARLLEQMIANTGKKFRNSDPSVKIFRLHASIGSENDAVFDEIPYGWRRIVLATNIAETSVTLPQVKHVIDTGTKKNAQRDTATGSRGLATVWIDQQSQQQRRGRAGRTSPGNFYALYTRAKLHTFDLERQPGMLKEDLLISALNVKACVYPMDIRSTFALAPDPPPLDEVERSITMLKHLGAITNDEELTPLGRVMNSLGYDPLRAKAVLLGILFRCLEPMLIAAAAGLDLIGYSESDAGGGKYQWHFSQDTESQTIANINAYKTYKEALESGDTSSVAYLTQEWGLRLDACTELTRNADALCLGLKRLGLLPDFDMSSVSGFPATPPELNTNSHKIPLIKALLAMSIETETAVNYQPHTWLSRQGIMMTTPNFVNEFKPSLVVKGIGGRVTAPGDILSYRQGRKVGQHKKMMDDSTMITPLQAMLVSEGVSVFSNLGTIKINNTVNMKVVFRNEPHKPEWESQQKRLSLVHEFRKLIDRFQHIAFSGLESLRPKMEGESSLPSNQMTALERDKKDTLALDKDDIADLQKLKALAFGDKVAPEPREHGAAQLDRSSTTESSRYSSPQASALSLLEQGEERAPEVVRRVAAKGREMWAPGSKSQNLMPLAPRSAAAVASDKLAPSGAIESNAAQSGPDVYKSPDTPGVSSNMFWGENDMRDALINGLVEILDIDAQVEAEVLQQRREIWEKERERRNKERALALLEKEAQSWNAVSQSPKPGAWDTAGRSSTEAHRLGL